MTTRAELRASVRVALEDPQSASPLWSDADLNECLLQAMREYGARFPLQKLSTVAVVAGTTDYALPAGVDPWRIAAVIDGNGSRIPKAPEVRDATGPSATSSGIEQGWSAFAGRFYLTKKPTAAQTWTIRHSAGRELVIDDVSAQPIEPGHEPIVIATAEARAWGIRANADTKRSNRADAARRQADAMTRAANLAAAAKRFVRAGQLQ